MKTMKWMLWVLLVIAAGCKSKDNSLTLLKSKEWQLKSMSVNGQEVKNPRELPTLSFSDSSAVYGSAGCNRFFGTYTADEGGKMTFKTGGATMMYCPDMDFEDAYLKALNTIVSYSVSEQELKLMSPDQQYLMVYFPADTLRKLGVQKDEHGCNAAAGYTWSEIRQDCIRLFEEGTKLSAVGDENSTMAAYIVWAVDSAQVEVFLPENETHPLLKRASLSSGETAWNLEVADSYQVRQLDGKWVVEQAGEILYRQLP